MTETAEISITLPAGLADQVRDAVASGRYQSESQVVHHALSDWSQVHNASEQTLDALKQAWQQGVATGPSTILDFDTVKAKARDHLSERTAKRAK